MKRLKLHKIACMLLAGITVFVSSCQDYEPSSDDVAKTVAYNREFTRQFGNIDPNQNWDLFGQLSGRKRNSMTRADVGNGVTVTDETTIVKVTREEATQYDKVLPESEVSAYSSYEETNLGTVVQDFVSSTHEFTLTPVHYDTGGNDVIGVYWYVDEPIEGVTTTVTGNDGKTYYIVRTQIYDNSLTDHLKGIVESTYYKQVTFGNDDDQWTELVTAYEDDYIVVEEGQTYYDQNHNAYAFSTGQKIYYTGNTGTTKEWQWNDETQQWEEVVTGTYPIFAAWPTGYSSNVSTSNFSTYTINQLIALHSEYILVPENSSTTYKDESGYNVFSAGTLIYEVSKESDASRADSRNSYDWFETGNATYLRSVPVTVTIPDGVNYFGFYLINANTGCVYSESNLNTPVVFPEGEKANKNSDACYVATFDIKDIYPEEESKRFLCFEDWYGTGTRNFDLNDLVFTVTGLDGHIEDKESKEEKALLVCEDLADFDFDFNDIVLMLNYSISVTRYYDTNEEGKLETSREVVEEFKIIPMAAGGAFTSNVYYGIPDETASDPTTSQTSAGEIHQLLGGSAPNIINAGATYPTNGEGTAIEISIDKLPEKNVGSGEGQYPTYLSQIFDVGFISIKCTDQRTDDNTQTNATIISSNKPYTQTGTAPQMMLLPYYFEWPQELVPIYNAYGGFQEWVTNISETDWIANSQVEKYITERGDFAEAIKYTVKATKNLACTNGHTFSYTDKNGKTTTYPNCGKVDFSSVTAAETEGCYASLKVTFSYRGEGVRVYLDFADGEQLLEDTSGQTEECTYRLSKAELQKAISTGAIYFMGQGNQTVSVESAILTIKQ